MVARDIEEESLRHRPSLYSDDWGRAPYPGAGLVSPTLRPDRLDTGRYVYKCHLTSRLN